MFSTLGATPTGLTAVDLNSPEDAPRLYGPYPVLRFVSGLEGNAAFLVPSARNGILLHTGNWSAAAGWAPPAPMPNSEGCVCPTRTGRRGSPRCTETTPRPEIPPR